MKLIVFSGTVSMQRRSSCDHFHSLIMCFFVWPISLSLESSKLNKLCNVVSQISINLPTTNSAISNQISHTVLTDNVQKQKCTKLRCNLMFCPPTVYTVMQKLVPPLLTLYIICVKA